MTRLLTCGYETGDVNEAGASTIGAAMTMTAVNASPAPRAGAYCLRMGPTGPTVAVSYKTIALPAAKTEVWVRFAFMCHGLLSNNEPMIALFNDAAGNGQCGITYSVADGLLRAYRGPTLTNLLGTSGTAFAQDAWHVIEWRTQILTLTTGATEVWLDGNRVINFSGDNSNTAALNVQTLQLGFSLSISGSVAGSYLAFDDIAVNDVAGSVNNGRAGDGRVVLLSPNGAGTTTQFVRGGTDTGANYSQVNELPPSLTQYVGSPTVGNRDLYTLQDLPVAVQSINVVEVLALAQNSDAGGGSLAPTVKSGATTNEATAVGLSTSAGYITGRWETDPNTSAAWGAAAVNALEAGATVR